MAHAAGVKLNDLRSRGGDGTGIHIRVDVRLHDGDVHLFFQLLDKPRQGGGLTRTGRGHNVEQVYALFLQLSPQLLSLGVVVGENALFDL